MSGNESKKDRWLRETLSAEAASKGHKPNEWCSYCGRRITGVWEYYNLARWHPDCNKLANNPQRRQWQKERKT